MIALQAMRESGHMVDLISELITDSLSPQVKRRTFSTPILPIYSLYSLLLI